MVNFLLLFVILFQCSFADENYYYKNNKKINLAPIYTTQRELSNIDYYQNEKGILLGVTDGLIVKLKDDVYLEIILEEFTLSLCKKLAKNLYLLKTKSKNLTLEVSNQVQKKEYVVYAHPDFIKKRVHR